MKSLKHFLAFAFALLGMLTAQAQINSCPAPVAQPATNISSTGVTIDWFVQSPIPSANTLLMRYRPVNTVSWISAAPASKPVVLSGLAPATTYEWQIAQVCSSSTGTAVLSPYSNIILFTTLSSNTTCPTPGGLLTDSITASSARVSWSPVTGAAGYLVRYRPAGSTTWTSINTAGNARVLTGLNPGTAYEWQVQTFCGTSNTNVSAWSAIVTFTTQPTTSPCPVPTGLMTDSITSSTARVYWTPAPGAIGYTVRYRPLGSLSWLSASSTTASRKLTGLLAGTQYEWQVQTVCSSNTSSGSTSAFSPYALFTTTANVGCPVPAGLITTAIGPSSVTLVWGATGASEYRVRYRRAGTTTWTTVVSTSNQRTLTGLLSASSYEWQVRGVCVSTTGTSVFSNWSVSVFFTTTAATACNTPTGLMADSITNTSARISWQAVQGVSGYQLNYRAAGSATWIWVAVSGNARVLSGLNPATTYECRVRSVCATASNTASNSAWSPSITFTTAPLVVVFPNPLVASGTLRLSSPSMTPVQVRVLDFSGELLWKTVLPAGTQESPIDLSELHNGLYLIEVNAEGLMQRTRVEVRK